jgi:hypothetical protein
MSLAAAVLGRRLGALLLAATVVELVLINSLWSRGTPSFGTARSDRSCPTVAGMMAAIGAASLSASTQGGNTHERQPVVRSELGPHRSR